MNTNNEYPDIISARHIKNQTAQYLYVSYDIFAELDISVGNDVRINYFNETLFDCKVEEINYEKNEVKLLITKNYSNEIIYSL